MGDDAKELFGPTLLLILTIVSWYFRPEDRKIIPSDIDIGTVNQQKAYSTEIKVRSI